MAQKAKQPMDIDKFSQALAETFVPLNVESRTREKFRGALRSQMSGSVHFTMVEGSSHTVHRTPELIAQGRQVFYKVALQLAGTGMVVQNNQELVLTPGSLTIYETGSPYSIMLEGDARTYVMMVPSTLVEVPRNSLQELVASPLHTAGSLGTIVTSHMQNLAAAPSAVNGPTGATLTRGTVELVTALLRSELAIQDTTPTPREALFADILDYINVHLADLDLTTSSIADAHFISIRLLQDLFQENKTTVSAWIRDRRLEECHRELTGSFHNHRSVRSIASGWGFLNPAHFSRIYRDKYRETPTQTRERCAATILKQP